MRRFSAIYFSRDLIVGLKRFVLLIHFRNLSSPLALRAGDYPFSGDTHSALRNRRRSELNEIPVEVYYYKYARPIRPVRF